MENEIDLRGALLSLTHRWRLILGAPLVAALVAGLVSWATPPTYDAAAVITTFEPSILELAVSMPILDETIAALGPDLPPELATPDRLRSRLKPSQEARTPIVYLTVEDADAERAAAMTNAWAEALVRRGPTLLSQANLDALTGAVDEASVARDAAERALAEFQASDRSVVWQVQMTTQLQTLQDAEQTSESLRTALRDAEDVRTRLAALKPTDPPAFGDYLAVLTLSRHSVLSDDGSLTILVPPEAASAAGSTAEGASTPSPAPVALPADVSTGELLSYLDQLKASFEARSAEIEAEVSSLSEAIMTTQARLAEAQSKANALTTARDQAVETYLQLVSDLAHARLTIASGYKSSPISQAEIIASTSNREIIEIRLVSHSSVPRHPSSPNLVQNVLVAGFLGLMLSALAAFGLEWWRAPQRANPDPSRVEP